MDAATLATAMGHVLSAEEYKRVVHGANDALRRAQCTTPPRAAMFLAQVGHESVGLRYSVEISSGEQYNGRQDLGNTQPGDGPRYKGHGYIQVTGRHNHREMGRWAYVRGWCPNPDYFVNNPMEAANTRIGAAGMSYAWLGAVWFWLTHGLNPLADRNDLIGATRVINGALNGLDDRRQRWQRCTNLGRTILPEDDLNKQETEALIMEALRAYHNGGPHGPFTNKKYPLVLKDANDGVGDRLRRLEQKTGVKFPKAGTK